MSSQGFKDHFSTQAAVYAKARPRYPARLFEWLAAQSPGHQLAWDAGCGNGQAARALVAHFERVVATDPSAAQIRHAEQHPHIDYRVEAAESPSLGDDSVDLISVAQARHWFDSDRFNASARRVLRSGGLIAAWTYASCSVSVDIDRVFAYLYDDLLAGYWPPERSHVESGYRDLPFPFAPVQAPDFAMAVEWTLAQYLDYLRSWSASQKFLDHRGKDAVGLVTAEFTRAWGDPETARRVHWPLSMRVGRKI